MADSSGWWAKKLGRDTQQQSPPQAYQGYPQAPQVPQGPPNGYPQYPQQQNLPGHQQPPSRSNAAQDWASMTTEQRWGSLTQMAGAWQGGKAAQVDRNPCPQCGSTQYFSRGAEGPSRLPPPAPHCYNCGYNGGLFQQGDPATWGATA